MKEEEENKLEDCGQHSEAEEGGLGGALQKERQIYEVRKQKIFTNRNKWMFEFDEEKHWL